MRKFIKYIEARNGLKMTCAGLLISVILMSGCVSNNIINEDITPSESEVKIEINQIEDVEIKLQEGTLTREGLTLTIKYNTNDRYTFGEDFYIEKYENGSWERIEEINENIAFNSIGYYAFEKELELNQKWDYIYGKLSNGKYKIIKSTFKEKDIPITKDDVKYVSLEFEIR